MDVVIYENTNLYNFIPMIPPPNNNTITMHLFGKQVMHHLLDDESQNIVFGYYLGEDNIWYRIMTIRGYTVRDFHIKTKL